MTNGTQDVWGIVLAGGEGERLKELICPRMLGLRDAEAVLCIRGTADHA